ncbi:hypothetical protein Herbaro_05910 [Herbaspirillum sp. WKF16]|uniref:hypothetical protein n=1 Tax=Herbaspirillum sp. WKF16 TaxID=3028312 RepID=UPI0023AA144A|nr:hypothetical protein [Herbaspirillum sp. WKF16]WDZ97322.1 hypothetical protein Herbaro_05910 [Herbaspirillum sp. WKF16]
MTEPIELIEDFSVASAIHSGESVHVRIRRDLTVRTGYWLDGQYMVDLYVGPTNRLARHYAGMSRRDANRVALHYLLEHVDGIAACI